MVVDHPRKFAAAEWVLLAVSVAFFVCHTLPRAWTSLNTDFPNYYLTAKLAHDGVDTSRAYEWRWLQREKDHREIDQRLIGLAPITPFSTLFVYPLTGLAPLQAKHVWLLLQLALLLPVVLLLRALSGQPLRRIWLLVTTSAPLARNLQYGQFYILLLVILVTACWAYRRRLSALAGALVALAALLKIFPAVFLLYFLRKRDMRALAAAALALAAGVLVALLVFGWPVHRYYLEAVLPWTLRGEVLPAYNLTSASITVLLHRLFVYEPQWNAHPWHDLPFAAAVLTPILQMMVLAPALLLVRPGFEAAETDRRAAPLEWSALLCATLAISTSPASYNFTLLLLPIVVLLAVLLPRRPLGALAALLCFAAIGYPGWNTAAVDGLRAVLHVPRLWCLVLFSGICCAVLARQHTHRGLRLRHGTNLRWVTGLTVALLFSEIAGVKHLHGLSADYAFRVPMPQDALLAGAPVAHEETIQTVAMFQDGYRVVTSPGTGSALPSKLDQLSFASSAAGDWIEESNRYSRILQPMGRSHAPIENAHAPMLSAEAQVLGYLRDNHGHSRLFVTNLAARGGTGQEQAVTPPELNVSEAASLLDGSWLVAATLSGSRSQLYLVKQGTVPVAQAYGEARYPAVSPDQQWLAYSRFQDGAWNLWLLDRSTGKRRRLTDAACNQIEPAWEADSKTLLYASDCGRALGFTAICRRKVIP